MDFFEKGTTVNNRAIGLMGRVFANGSGDQGSVPGQIIPKTQKMVFDTILLKTRHSVTLD